MRAGRHAKAAATDDSTRRNFAARTHGNSGAQHGVGANLAVVAKRYIGFDNGASADATVRPQRCAGVNMCSRVDACRRVVRGKVRRDVCVGQVRVTRNQPVAGIAIGVLLGQDDRTGGTFGQQFFVLLVGQERQCIWPSVGQRANANHAVIGVTA